MKAPDESLMLSTRKHRLTFESAADREEFMNDYSLDEQDRVRDLHDRMMRIEGAKNPHRGSKEAAKHSLWSPGYLNALYVEWVAAERDWHWLVNKSKYPEAREPALPQAFRDWCRTMFSGNQRKDAPAYRKIMRQWEAWLRTGDSRYSIPGYEQCPMPSATHAYPRGWSKKNLSRFSAPPAEKILARIGVAAAMALLPKIPGTREGIRFLEYVSGDDVWLDRKAIVPGFGDCRVVQFGMMDYAASYYLDGFIQRPIIPRKDGTTEQLKRRDFLWCVAMMLERYGFPLDYVMHIICERGTATMTKAEARFLYEISEGHIIVGWSTMEGEMVHAWEERQTGNSNAKPWHESFHNIFHNEQADLPGQVGKDRDHSPAALLGSDKAALALNDVAMLVTPEQRAQFKFPYPDMVECMQQTVERVGFINGRKEHACEGFKKVLDWRPKGLRCLPMPEAELITWLQANPRADINTDVDWFPRPESPRERMLRISQDYRFQRLPGTVYRAFYQDCHETRRIADDGSFAFERTINGAKRKFRFEPSTPDEAIKPGTEVTGFFRPDGSAIHLFAGSQDRFLLTWPAVTANRRGDAAAKQVDFQRKRTFLNHAIANVRADRADEIAEAKEALQNNVRIMAEAGLLDDGVDRVTPEAPQILATVQDGCTGAATAVQDVQAKRAANTAANRRKEAAKAEEARRAVDAARAASAARARSLIATE